MADDLRRCRRYWIRNPLIGALVKSVEWCNFVNMKLGLLVTASALIFVAGGCAVGAEDSELAASAIVDAEAACAEAVADEYEQAQRPPDLDVRSTGRDGDAVVVAGISRGKTTNPVPFEFECRHIDGTTSLDLFERADDEESLAPTTSETPDVDIDKFANSLTDEQLAVLTHGLQAQNAELACQAAAGIQYVPVDQKPFRADMHPPTPYRGGFLVAGEIQGANGLVAKVGCRVDSDNEAEVTRFEVVN